MSRAKYGVDILGDDGEVIGQKPRYLLDKQRDMFYSVHVVLVTPRRELVLSLIPQREELPNLYAGMLGTTMATVLRHGETPERAARRGLAQELLLEAAPLEFLRGGMMTLADGRRVNLTGYVLRAERPALYRDVNVGELMVMAPEGVEVAMGLHSDQFSPTLKGLWPSLRAWCEAAA